MKATQNVIRAILAKPGMEPEICILPQEQEAQKEAIGDLLMGNFGATEFFDLQNGASLFILSNDLSIPLGQAPNRRFPGEDRETILFGNVIFAAAYNESSAQEGAIDMPEKICRMFIEQIKRSFEMCKGDERPDSKAEVYTENAGTDQERSYKWRETEKPASLDEWRALPAGRARWLTRGEQELLEINGRYFRQIPVMTEKTPLH